MTEFKRDLVIKYPKGHYPSDELIDNLLEQEGLTSEQVNIIRQENNRFERDGHYHFYKDYIKRINAVHKAILSLLEVSLDKHSSKYTLLLIQLQRILDNCIASLKNQDNHHIPEKIYNNALHVMVNTLHDIAFADKTPEEIAEQIDLAECYDLMAKPRPILCTLVNLEHLNKKLLLVNKPLSTYVNEDELLITPAHLCAKEDKIEKKLYENAINKITQNDIPFSAVSLSSRHDSIPGPRNFRENKSYFIDDNDQLIHGYTGTNLSIIGSRSQSLEINKAMAYNNLVRCIEESIANFRKKNSGWPDNKPIPIAYLTLITPGLKKEDTELYELKLWAIEEYKRNHGNFALDGKQRIDLIEGNFSVNLGRHLFPTLNDEDNGRYQTCQKIMAYAADYCQNRDNPSVIKVNHALEKLQQVLAMSYMDILFSPSFKRELYIVALLHIICDEIGIVFGGCISCKDRAMALSTMINTLLAEYTEENGFLAFNDNDRESFVNTMVDIDDSGFSQDSSEQNAEGVRATKFKSMIYSHPFCQESKHRHGEKYLSQEDRLASTNDCHKEIKKNKKKETSYSLTERLLQPNTTQTDNNYLRLEIEDLLAMLKSDANKGKFTTILGGSKNIQNGKLKYKVPRQVTDTINLLQEMIDEKDDIVTLRVKHYGTEKHWLEQLKEDFIQKSKGGILRTNRTCKQYERIAKMLSGFSIYKELKQNPITRVYHTSTVLELATASPAA